MKKINFKQFSMPDGVAGEKQITGDVSESFAKVIYNYMTGIAAKVLAEKIYKTEGAAEYDDKEIDIMRRAAADYCLPRIIDGLEAQLADVEADTKGAETAE